MFRSGIGELSKLLDTGPEIPFPFKRKRGPKACLKGGGMRGKFLGDGPEVLERLWVLALVEIILSKTECDVGRDRGGRILLKVFFELPDRFFFFVHFEVTPADAVLGQLSRLRLRAFLRNSLKDAKRFFMFARRQIRVP